MVEGRGRDGLVFTRVGLIGRMTYCSTRNQRSYKAGISDEFRPRIGIADG